MLLGASWGNGACADRPSTCGQRTCPSDASTYDGGDLTQPDLVAVEHLIQVDLLPDVCGDQRVTDDEECDDGNLLSGDGCSADCRLEQIRCPAPFSEMFCDVRPVTCGDGVRATLEPCDDGNALRGDGCAADCTTVEPGWRCRVPGRRCVPICGDGLIVGGETCDDGNVVDGDGCSSTCLTESGAAFCGDGVIEGGEECDLGAGAGDDDEDRYDGCTKTCLFGPHCGDAHVDPPFEDCDLGSDNVALYGTGCTRACHFPPACGDAIVSAAFEEQCDDGPLNGQPGSACSRSCHRIIK
jgi:cysteine-rich repeat protein